MIQGENKKSLEDIKLNQDVIRNKLLSTDESVSNLAAKVGVRVSEQAQLEKRIQADVSSLESSVKDMRDRIENVTSRILGLIEMNEAINESTMYREVARELEKQALEVQEYAAKKRVALEDLKKSFSAM